MSDSSTHLTTDTLAARWHRRPQTIRLMRHEGRGPKYIRLGSSSRCPVLYRLADIIAYEEDHLYSHTAAEAVTAGADL